MKRRLILHFAFFGALLLSAQLSSAQLSSAQLSSAQLQSAPSPRSGFSLAFDSYRGVVVLFGGQDSVNGRLGDTWFCKDGYDDALEAVILYGGYIANAASSECWILKDGVWQNWSGDSGPAPRAEHRCIFIPGQGLFLFGGVIGPDANTRKRGNDTWLFDGAWRKID